MIFFIPNANNIFLICFSSSVIRRVGALLGRMSSEVSAEAQRIGAWGILGQGIGAQLVATGSDNTPVDREELFGKETLCFYGFFIFQFVLSPFQNNVIWFNMLNNALSNY